MRGDPEIGLGHRFTLGTRDFLEKLRETGVQTGGPAPERKSPAWAGLVAEAVAFVRRGRARRPSAGLAARRPARA